MYQIYMIECHTKTRDLVEWNAGDNNENITAAAANVQLQASAQFVTDPAADFDVMRWDY